MSDVITCPRCGNTNRLEARFCRHCGVDVSPTRNPHREDVVRPHGERTVVRLADFTRLNR
jgi:NMD protein affecting ribosome stability and mRNA decay